MRKNTKSKSIKYLNEFPIIIITAIIVIVLILIIMYLQIKPQETIYRDGYMILAENMTYNLINDNGLNKVEELNVGVAPVENGDYFYKQLGEYYVGVEKKVEVDYDYPIYSKDGLTIYNLNANSTLIDRNFEKMQGYSGFSLNHGILYNDGENEPADNVDYLFLYLNNSIYINTQFMTVKTSENEYTIPMHSPIYFDSGYINFYIFDGKKFEYNNIGDIYYDSILKIGDVTLTYTDFLLQMELLKLGETIPEIDNNDSNQNENNDSLDQIENENNSDETLEIQYVKPGVSVSKFSTGVYSATAKISIIDTANVITKYPIFEIYTADGKLYSRKKINATGEIKLSGLASSTEYKIVGTYKYENEEGVVLEKKINEEIIVTKGVDELDAIKLSSSLGEIYSNQIEIKDLQILNYDVESVSGIKRIVLNITDEQNNEHKDVELSYYQIKKLISGEKVTVNSSKNLLSGTVYKYIIEIYDKGGNKLKCYENIEGKIKTSKEKPYVESNIKRKNDYSFDINMKVINLDNIYIKDFKYELYDSAGYLIKEDVLDYENGMIEMFTQELDYNSNYILKVTGIYDVEDGKGETDLIIEKSFSTSEIQSNLDGSYYDTASLEVTYNSIKSDIYLSSNAVVLQKEDTEVIVSLVDKDGNDILDENGGLKHYKKYKKEEYDNSGRYHIQSMFENLNSNTEYKIKVQLVVKQLNDVVTVEKILEPSITTEYEDAYVTVVNKKLLGDVLDIRFKVNDPSNFIDKKSGIIVEIYEGTFDNAEDAKKSGRYIYRNRFELSENNLMEFNLKNYLNDSYTAIVISDNYNGLKNQKYITINGGSENKNVINISEGIVAYVEMYQQKTIGAQNKVATELNFSYDLYDSVSNIYFLDCQSSTCTTLGYLDSEKKLNIINSRLKSIDSNPDEPGKQILTMENPKANVMHNFYIAIGKENYKPSSSFNELSVTSNMYILDSLEYSTAYDIFNINDASDFFDTGLIRKNNENKHYVVTKNINFGDGISTFENVITKQYFTNFKGEIDFQGYEINLYKNNISNISLFNRNYGVLKNLVVNYSLDYQGVESVNIPGLVDRNDGTIENIIVNVKQTYETGRGYRLALIAYNNYGTINNFVVYLKSDISIFNSSSLVTWSNNSKAVISNGYITYDPGVGGVDNSGKTRRPKVKLYNLNSNGYGSFANRNSGVIKNIYNTVSVENVDKTTSPITTITCSNAASGTVKNVISVADVTKYVNNGEVNGPNIWNNNGGKISNNYYVDNNLNGFSYTNNINSKIGRSVLINSSTWNIILNSDNSYSITLGYYPILKMNKFMQSKQKNISIEFDYMKESNVDIISTEVIQNNINKEAAVKVYVSNPSKYIIKDIFVEELTTEIDSNSVYYDDTMEATVLTLKLKLGKNDKAKSVYNITGFTYSMDENDIEHQKNYADPSEYRLLNIDMYRKVDNYSSLINYINNNENIYLTENIEYSGINNYPRSGLTYSAILDGNEKTCDFKNQPISRGYFISNLYGVVKNLQVKNLKLNTENRYVGFIGYCKNCGLDNIDVLNSVIEMNNQKNVSARHMGVVVGYLTNSIINKISVNNVEVTNLYNGGYASTTIIGGIAGNTGYSEILNSYAYNFQINGLKKESPEGVYELGGITGHSYASIIENCYTTGTFDSNYSQVGGITGRFDSGNISNNYSYLKIRTTGTYVGGIGGLNVNGSPINSNMFIGEMVNKSNKSTVSLIAPGGYTTDNYVLKSGYGFKIVKDTSNLEDFDKNDSFQRLSVEKLPYLKETSFVEQQVKNINFVNFNSTLYYQKIEYNKEESCNVKQEYSESVCAESAKLIMNDFYTLDYKFVNNKYETEDLIITKVSEYEYIIKPKKYLNNYKLNIIKDTNKLEIDVGFSFYKKIKNISDWNTIEDFENIVLMENININSGEITTNKKINNFLGNDKEVSGEEGVKSPNNIIDTITGNMKDVTFKNIEINDSVDFTSLIKNNEGNIENCNFSNIKITSTKNKTGIIANNAGYIKKVNLNSITVDGFEHTGGLVALETADYKNKTQIQEINADNISVKGSSYVGGIISKTNSQIANIHVKNIEIEGYQIVGGIIGYGICNNASLTGEANTISYKKDKVSTRSAGRYIGGIGGQQGVGSNLSTLVVSNLDIIDTVPEETKERISGVYGGAWYFKNAQVDNLRIIGENGERFIANYVGGIGERGGHISYSSIKNSEITGKSNVGGMIGVGLSNITTTFVNLVYGTVVDATGSGVGGLYGNLSAFHANPNTTIKDSMIVTSEISGGSKVGGLIGSIPNEHPAEQSLNLNDNFVINTIVQSGESATEGGIIGHLTQVPSSDVIKFNNNLFNNRKYGEPSYEVESLIGKIDKLDTGIETGYGTNISKEDFIIKSNFKEYVEQEELSNPTYQINSVAELEAFINHNPAYTFVHTTENKYFPKFSTSYTNTYSHLDLTMKELPKIDYDSESGILNNELPSTLTLRNSSNAYKNPVDIKYDIYSSGVNKINIEFNKINSNMYFSYKINDYVSEYIPINNRTYTLTYNYKNPIEIYVTNGINYKNSIVKPEKISKTISIINGTTYYINNGLLYNESKMITGNYKNLYNNEVLTNDGKVYNLETQIETDANIDYNILQESIPIYEFTYDGNYIKTYYNYSTVNGIEKEYQLFVKNGNLNSISSSLNNKKNMYIIDYYNNNEIQVILKDNGKLYNIKHNIKYPANIVNDDIYEIYTNINSTETFVTLKYTNGAVNTFDYRTGEMLFTNVDNSNMSLLEYIKNKVTGNSSNNIIENISSDDKYREVELLKDKMDNFSLEQVEDKIYNTNLSLSNKDKYITVYNDITRKYDVYKTSAMLDGTVEAESETEKMYRNYELVHFYGTLGKTETKNSLSGVIIFGISIISVLVALVLLWKHKLVKRAVLHEEK